MSAIKEGLRTVWPFALLGLAYTGLLVVSGDWKFSHGLLAGLWFLTGAALGAATIRAACEDQLESSRKRIVEAELARWEALKSALPSRRNG